MVIKATRLRFISSSSAEELETAVQLLPFKIEIKNVVAKGPVWYCWFVLPDNVSNTDLENAADRMPKSVDVDVNSLALDKL